MAVACWRSPSVTFPFPIFLCSPTFWWLFEPLMLCFWFIFTHEKPLAVVSFSFGLLFFLILVASGLSTRRRARRFAMHIMRTRKKERWILSCSRFSERSMSECPKSQRKASVHRQKDPCIYWSPFCFFARLDGLASSQLGLQFESSQLLHQKAHTQTVSLAADNIFTMQTVLCTFDFTESSCRQPSAKVHPAQLRLCGLQSATPYDVPF